MHITYIYISDMHNLIQKKSNVTIKYKITTRINYFSKFYNKFINKTKTTSEINGF